jgi:asparagine synthase (glutamine-hydrolysing)
LDLSAVLAREAGGARARHGSEANHRGPDAHGLWADAEAGVVLGHTRFHRRLSPAGRSRWCRAVALACVLQRRDYNAGDLRPGWAWPALGHSDTEVIEEAIANGASSPRLRPSAFRLAPWDRRDRTLAPVRDRLGIKPLYYGRQNGRLVFQERAGLEVLPHRRSELNQTSPLICAPLMCHPPDSSFVYR